MLQPNPGLARSIVASLCDHPHDDTVPRLTARLDGQDPGAVAHALRELRLEGVVIEGDGHWQLSRLGWRIARDESA